MSRSQRRVKREAGDGPLNKTGEVSLQPLLLSVPQVSKLLGLSRTTVYKLIDTEGLPVMRFGRAVRVRSLALQSWLEQRERGAVA